LHKVGIGLDCFTANPEGLQRCMAHKPDADNRVADHDDISELGSGEFTVAFQGNILYVAFELQKEGIFIEV